MIRIFTRERGSRKEKERIVLGLCAAAVFVFTVHRLVDQRDRAGRDRQNTWDGCEISKNI